MSDCPLTCEAQRQGSKFVAGCVFPPPSSPPSSSPSVQPSSDFTSESPTIEPLVAEPGPVPQIPSPSEAPSSAGGNLSDAPTATLYPSSPNGLEICLLTVEEDKCTRLMENAERREECDCYNFCNEVEIGKIKLHVVQLNNFEDSRLYNSQTTSNTFIPLLQTFQIVVNSTRSAPPWNVLEILWLVASS